MISFPNSKINLGLHVTEKRHDGFHNIKSVFYPISLTDILEVINSDKESITIGGYKLPGNNNDNLCIKAYNILKEKFDLPIISFYLHKKIPAGAGLGGGSSDAAFTVKLLNSVFKLDLSENDMEELVRPIGSDCAFFIRNKPVYAYNKGDVFKPVNLNLNNKYISIVKPPVHISTPEAYSKIQPKNSRTSPFEIIKMPLENWKDLLSNDFEEVFLKKYPELINIKHLFYEHGAVYSSMSGSGSAFYGIFNNPPPKINFPDNYFTWQGKML